MSNDDLQNEWQDGVDWARQIIIRLIDARAESFRLKNAEVYAAMTTLKYDVMRGFDAGLEAGFSEGQKAERAAIVEWLCNYAV